MIGGLATALIIGSLALALASLVIALRGRPVGIVSLIGLGGLEAALLVQAVIAVVRVLGGEGPKEPATLYGYLVGIVLIPPAAAYLGLAERTKWGAVSVAIGCFAVPVMVGRLLQLWQGAP